MPGHKPTTRRSAGSSSTRKLQCRHRSAAGIAGPQLPGLAASHGAEEPSGEAHQVERGICAVFQVRPQGFLQVLGWDVPLHTDGCRSSRQPVQLRQLQRCPVPDLEASPSHCQAFCRGFARHFAGHLPTLAPGHQAAWQSQRFSSYHSVRPLLRFLSTLLVLNKQA